jgi:hypothetical protein
MPTAEQITAHEMSRNGARPGAAAEPAPETPATITRPDGDSYSETFDLTGPDGGPVRIRVNLGYTKTDKTWSPKDFTADATWNDRNDIEGDQLITYGRMAQRVITALCEEFNRPRPEDTPF